jgi:predicted RNA-binding Zn-ribbon protein involved in translation (DUF1610 family)
MRSIPSRWAEGWGEGGQNSLSPWPCMTKTVDKTIALVTATYGALNLAFMGAARRGALGPIPWSLLSVFIGTSVLGARECCPACVRRPLEEHMAHRIGRGRCLRGIGSVQSHVPQVRVSRRVSDHLRPVETMDIVDWIVDLIRWICDEVAAWVHRRRRKKEEDPTKCQNCQYSLEGTLEAGIARCPECGQNIARWQRAEWRHRTR